LFAIGPTTPTHKRIRASNWHCCEVRQARREALDPHAGRWSTETLHNVNAGGLKSWNQGDRVHPTKIREKLRDGERGHVPLLHEFVPISR
jgi:hypothetical protein